MNQIKQIKINCGHDMREYDTVGLHMSASCLVSSYFLCMLDWKIWIRVSRDNWTFKQSYPSYLGREFESPSK